MNPQKQQEYIDNLPPKPYCSNDLAYGLKVRPKAKAITYQHIQHNKPTSVKYLVIDCDETNTYDYIKDNNLPLPNWICVNPANGHSHIYYTLAVPVYKCNAARQGPLRFLEAVERTLTTKIKGDKGYVGLVSKNPLNSAWHYLEGRRDAWDLNEFLEYFDLEKKKRIAVNEAIGLGRNCSLFDGLRMFAYAEKRHHVNIDTFSKAVLDKAEQINTQFFDPLIFNEIKATAKSVSKWVWRNFDVKASDEKFSKIQSARRNKRTNKMISMLKEEVEK